MTDQPKRSVAEVDRFARQSVIGGSAGVPSVVSNLAEPVVLKR
jgi:hypothetical protein